MLPANRYQMNACVTPSTGKVGVHVCIDWYAGRGDADEIVFALHRSACVHRFAGPPGARYELRPEAPVPYAPEAATLLVRTAGPPGDHRHLRMELEYELQLGVVAGWEVNRVTPEWVELGLYFPWFPLDASYRPFTFTLRLEIPEPGYAVTGNGVVRRRNGQRVIDSELADKDLIVVAAPSLKELVAGSVRMVYARDEDRDAAARALDDCAWLLERFTDWFGPPPHNRLTMVIAPRTKGGGYARRNVVVLTPGGLEQRSVAFRWIAHELAHLWWQRADATGWEDWLNEAFAEFSSVLAVRRRSGEDRAEELLAARQAKLPGLPPIFGLPRGHDQAHAALYAKGCVLLHRLEQAIGREAMMRLLRRMNDRAVATTAGFLELLADIGGRGPAEEFSAWLRE